MPTWVVGPVSLSQVGDESDRKQHRALAEQHYSKAVRLFISLSDAPCELLRTLLERVAFAEFTMAGEKHTLQEISSGRVRWDTSRASYRMFCCVFQVRTAVL